MVSYILLSVLVAGCLACAPGKEVTKTLEVSGFELPLPFVVFKDTASSVYYHNPSTSATKLTEKITTFVEESIYSVLQHLLIKKNLAHYVNTLKEQVKVGTITYVPMECDSVVDLKDFTADDAGENIAKGCSANNDRTEIVKYCEKKKKCAAANQKVIEPMYKQFSAELKITNDHMNTKWTETDWNDFSKNLKEEMSSSSRYANSFANAKVSIK